VVLFTYQAGPRKRPRIPDYRRTTVDTTDIIPYQKAAHAIASMILNIDANVTAQYVEAAHRAIIFDMGSWPSVTAAIEAYEQADRSGDTSPYSRAIGARVCGLLAEDLLDFRSEAEASGLSTMILDLVLAPVDLESGAQQRLIGEYFLPSPQDLNAADYEKSADED
jgi:hypothetical protein